MFPFMLIKIKNQILFVYVHVYIMLYFGVGTVDGTDECIFIIQLGRSGVEVHLPHMSHEPRVDLILMHQLDRVDQVPRRTNSSRSFKSLESTIDSNTLLQLDHALLITNRIVGILHKRPLQELIGIVGLEAFSQDAESLPVARDLGPVPLHVLHVLGKVRIAALKDLAVQGRGKDGLEVSELRPRLVGVSEYKVRRLLGRAKEGADFVRILTDELLVADVEDGAEAAAAQLGELVDAEHLHVRLGAALGIEPLFEFDHLDVLETDTGVDISVDDGLGDVHATADGGVVCRGEAIVGGLFMLVA